MMQEVLRVLAGLLKPEKMISVRNSTISIVETGRQATLKRVDVVSVGQETVVVKLDLCGFPGQVLFVDQHPMHKACDAVTFCVVGGAPYILCFELKSSEPGREEIAQQFRSAHCLLEYLDSLLITYHKVSIRDWPRHYFLFHDQAKTPLAKTPLIEAPLDNTTPERAIFWPVQNGEKIYLRKLVGRLS